MEDTRENPRPRDPDGNYVWTEEDFFEDLVLLKPGEIEIVDDVSILRTRTDEMFAREMSRAKQWAHQQCMRERVIKNICRHQHPYTFLHKCVDETKVHEECLKERVAYMEQKAKLWGREQLAKYEEQIYNKLDKQKGFGKE